MKYGCVMTTHTPEITPAGGWMLPNRIGFPAWVADMFNYPSTASDRQGLYVQQRFVRDFLQPASPYRGMLLFHGLGVGKTCASIAAADVLRPPSMSRRSSRSDLVSRFRHVFVFLPASLRSNFMAEVRSKCGDSRFYPSRTWKIDASSRFVPTLADDPECVHFDSMTPAERDTLLAQIDDDIADAYTFVHYNGLSAAAVSRLCDTPSNPFDDSVVIIDEAPNFIGPVLHGKLLARVYQRVMDADQCKVVLLTGTPLVNSPLELAYYANLVHGYIHTLSFTSIPPGADVRAALDVLSVHPSVDHASSDMMPDGPRINLTLFPHGFVRASELGPPLITLANDGASLASLMASLRAIGSSASGVTLRAPLHHKQFLLPIDPDAFADAFISSTDAAPNSSPVAKNIDVLIRRLLGTVSVFSSTDPALMPTILPAVVVRLPMSPRQYEEYLLQREIERRKERTAAMFAARAGAGAGARAGRGARPGSGDSTPSSKLYRAFSRATCTFAFPEGIKRPYRSDFVTAKAPRTSVDADVIEDESGDDDHLDADSKKKASSKAYDAAIASVLSRISHDRTRMLALNGSLPSLSPKYASLISHLRRPESATRPAIVYSQFRRVEGLGLLRLALVANGFVELRVSGTRKAGSLVLSTFPDKAPQDAPRFIVYGNDDIDASSAMLKIFNSQLSTLPSSMSTSLRRIVGSRALDAADGNKHGAIARLLLITQSGSEGISTRNVREVHILEPFWHANRVLQVVGRAARSNSHSDLPPVERTVEVRVYVATFTPDQRSDTTIEKMDHGLTSDEHVLAVATRKRALLEQFNDALRSAAIDCVMHHPKTAGRRCFAHPKSLVSRKGLSALSFDVDLSKDLATTGRHVRLVPFVTANGVDAYLDPSTGIVYDKAAHALHGRLVRITHHRPGSALSMSTPASKNTSSASRAAM